MASHRVRIPLLPILFVSIALAGGCAQRKAPSSSPASSRHHRAETGKASWYGKAHQGKRTASGERFDMHALTAAHRTLPFGTIVRVTDLRSGKSVDVRINDRGPFHHDRIIDLSYEAARKLGFVERGTARVEVVVVERGGRRRESRIPAALTQEDQNTQPRFTRKPSKDWEPARSRSIQRRL